MRAKSLKNKGRDGQTNRKKGQMYNQNLSETNKHTMYNIAQIQFFHTGRHYI